jgi:hypothetical protein
MRIGRGGTHGCITAVRRERPWVVSDCTACSGFRFSDACLLDDVSLSAVHFNYTYAPSPKDNTDENMADAHAHIDATVAQLFYTSNMFHDLTYRYVSLAFMTYFLV